MPTHSTTKPSPTEMNLEKSPLSQLVLGLCLETQTDPGQQHNKNAMRMQKENYLTHCKESTRKQSHLECYLESID